MYWVRVFGTVFQQKYTMGLFLFDITHFMVPLTSVGANNDLLLKFQPIFFIDVWVPRFQSWMKAKCACHGWVAAAHRKLSDTATVLLQLLLFWRAWWVSVSKVVYSQKSARETLELKTTLNKKSKPDSRPGQKYIFGICCADSARPHLVVTGSNTVGFYGWDYKILGFLIYVHKNMPTVGLSIFHVLEPSYMILGGQQCESSDPFSAHLHLKIKSCE